MKKWEIIIDELKKEFLEHENELLKREKELQILHEIDLRILDKQITLNETYNFILDKTKELLEAKYVELLIRKGKELEIVASTNPSDIRKKVLIDDSVSGLSIKSGKITNCRNRNEGKFKKLYKSFLGTEEEPILSELVVPIILENAPIGVINIESPKIAAFDEEHERLATILTTQAKIAFVNSRLIDNISLFTRIEKLLFSPGTNVSLQQIFQLIVAELEKYVPIETVQILFCNEQKYLVVEYSTQPDDIGFSVAIENCVSGIAIEEKKIIIKEDVSSNPRYTSMLGSNIKSEIVAPIFSQEEIIGVINIESSEKGVFDPYFQYILEIFSKEVSNIIALIKLRRELESALVWQDATEIFVVLGDQVGHIIHRINNLVGAMKFWLEEIEYSCDKELKNNSFLRERINDLQKGVAETLALPKGLKETIEKSSVDINQIIKNELEKSQLPDNIKIELKLDQNIPKIESYSFNLVVFNLIKNAKEAMPDGGCLNISTKLIFYNDIKDKKMIEITVADTGKGISEKDSSQIFNVDFTTKDIKEGKGLGFGLWWVKKFIERLKGTVNVCSKEGEGTTFIIKIPIQN